MNIEAKSLTSETVEDLFKACLSDDGEIFEGVVHSAKLDVRGSEDEIGALLAQLPVDFMEDGGGGASFLMACENSQGEIWTDLHMIMDLLFLLGIAAGKAEFLMPRTVWSALPGGKPYIRVKAKSAAEAA